MVLYIMPVISRPFLNQFNIGVDIEDIARFKRLDFARHRNFYERIFHKNEIRYCLRKKNPYQHFAARFCAKEALIKAIKEKIIDPTAIEVKFADKKPFIVWNKKKYPLSMAHEKNKAIAFVAVKK